MGPTRVVVVLSGGMDSAVLLAFYRSLNYEVHAISFDYGQRHAVELKSAAAIADYYSAGHEIVDMRSIKGLFKGSSQTDDSVPVPHGHYTAESMKKTVVPNRNMIMISIAAAHAIAIKAETLAFGAHSGDHAIYPDCRPAFVLELAKALMLADWSPARLASPFIDFTKAQICALGERLRVPFYKTWSCYDPQPAGRPSIGLPGWNELVHCGRCGTCVERREAFDLAGVKDPTEYAIVAPVAIAAPVGVPGVVLGGDLNGTCAKGSLRTSFGELVRLFGPPNGNGDGYKVSTEWVLTYGGQPFSIYDYKGTRSYESDLPTVEEFRRLPEYDWHIGGRVDARPFIAAITTAIFGA